MDVVNKKRTTKYDRVMSRLHNRSRSTVDSSSTVTRHRVLSSARVGAKASSSNLSSGLFNELPVVLNDYVPDKPVQKTFVVKPRKTIKSLDPTKSPHQVLRPNISNKPLVNSPYVRGRGSTPSVLYRSANKCLGDNNRECLSSRSHSRVKELENEIQAYHETDKLMKLRSRLYKSCGVVLDDLGQVAVDKAVQAEPLPEPEKEVQVSRRQEWLTAIDREDLLKEKTKNKFVCSAHFDDSAVITSISKRLKTDAVPTKVLPNKSHTNSKDVDKDNLLVPTYSHIQTQTRSKITQKIMKQETAESNIEKSVTPYGNKIKQEIVESNKEKSVATYANEIKQEIVESNIEKLVTPYANEIKQEIVDSNIDKSVTLYTNEIKQEFVESNIDDSITPYSVEIKQEITKSTIVDKSLMPHAKEIKQEIAEPDIDESSNELKHKSTVPPESTTSTLQPTRVRKLSNTRNKIKICRVTTISPDEP